MYDVISYCVEPADEHVEGGIYISPEFQLGQVYDGAADVVEDVILYRPVYVCAPRHPSSDIGNGHSPSVRGVDHTPSPSPVAGSPSAAGRPRAAGVSPAGSVEHLNAHSSPSHGRTTATKTTKKVESTTTTTTVNEHHHQHRHHHHHAPHLLHQDERSEPLQHARLSHDVIVHGSGGRDLDPVKSAVIGGDDVRLTDGLDASGSTSDEVHIMLTDEDHIVMSPGADVASSSTDCNSTNVPTHCSDVTSGERDTANPVCQQTSTN